MAVQTCAALRKFDARSEAASSKIRLLGRHSRNAGAFGASGRKGPDDPLLVRPPAPPEGRRAPLPVMDGNYPRLSGVSVVERHGRPAMTSIEFPRKPTTPAFSSLLRPLSTVFFL